MAGLRLKTFNSLSPPTEIRRGLRSQKTIYTPSLKLDTIYAPSRKPIHTQSKTGGHVHTQPKSVNTPSLIRIHTQYRSWGWGLDVAGVRLYTLSNVSTPAVIIRATYDSSPRKLYAHQV